MGGKSRKSGSVSKALINRLTGNKTNKGKKTNDNKADKGHNSKLFESE